MGDPVGWRRAVAVEASGRDSQSWMADPDADMSTAVVEPPDLARTPGGRRRMPG